MESKTKGYLFAILSLAAIIIIFSYLNIKTSPEASIELYSCDTIQYSPDNSFNVVFVGDKEEAQAYAEFIRQTPPYNEFEGFNLLNVEKSPKCTRYREIATYCNNPETLQLAASCPSTDVIVALKQEDSSSIRASAHEEVISINTKVPQKEVFTHELGHIFGLAEEYEGVALPRNHPNCRRNPEEFDINDGTFEGCSEPKNYFRSVENGVMRTLSSNYYGVFNQRWITEKLKEEIGEATRITGSQILEDNPCESQQYVAYSAATGISTINPGCVTGNGLGNARFEITGGGQVIYTDTYGADIFTDEASSDGSLTGETYDGTNDLILTFPSPAPGDKIIIYDENNQIIKQASLKEAGALACATTL